MKGEAPFFIAGTLLVLIAGGMFIFDRQNYGMFQDALFIGLAAIAIGFHDRRHRHSS